MTASLPTIITFAIYLFIMLFLGWLGYKATNTLSDYILGGRRLGSVITALSAGASDMSGWLLMGLPGLVYLSGLSGAWIAIGLVIGAWLNWRFVAARLRAYTEKCGNALTLPDYFTNRFKDKTNILRIVTALAILIFFTLYCASGVVAGARLFENMFGMSYQTALWVGALATISYVFIGGFLAVSWTDAVQASLMITALIVTPLMVIYSNGGFAQSAEILQTQHQLASHLNLIDKLTLIQIISLLAWGLGYFGQPHILVRFMAAKSIAVLPAARRISIAWMIFCLAGTVSIGVFGAVYFASVASPSALLQANSEMIFIELTKFLFNPWIAGLLLAAILAAVMSTLSCQLLVSSSALTEDIYRTFIRKNASQRELVWIGRLMVLAVALIAIKLAWNPESQVLKMVSYAWAGFGAAFGPIIVFSLLWSRVTRNGAIAGIVVGAATVIIWKQFGGWFGLYEIIPGFIFSSLAIIIVSCLDRAPAREIKQTFDEVQEEISRA